MPQSNVIPLRRSRAPASPLPVYLQTLAPSGRRSIRSLLNSAVSLIERRTPLESFDWTGLRYEDLVQVRFMMLNLGRSYHTVNATLSAFRGLMRTSFNMGLIDADTMLRAISVKSVKGESLPAGRALSKEEVRLLLKAARSGKGLIAIRNRAMVYLLVNTGIRRDELVNLKVGDYHPPTRELVIRCGKGRRQRVAHLSAPCANKLNSWLKLVTVKRSPMFCRIRKGERLTHAALSTQAVYDVVRELSEEARIGRSTPHDLRRTFITRKLDAGVDIATVSRLAGHRDIKTVLLYDRRKTF